VTYDYKSKKIVAVISESLEPWQSMNVLGHMAVALGANKDSELMGRQVLSDQSCVPHAGIARFGFIIKKGGAVDIASLIGEARKEPGLIIVDFPREMLDTRHDDELAESMSKKQESDFDYLGVLLYGSADLINSLTKNFKLWS
jgi:hypothetical protein